MPTRSPSFLAWTALLFLLIAAPSEGQGPPIVGDTIQLRATHHLGVPLHALPQPTDNFQRVLDGAQAKVLEIREGRWHRIRVLPSGPEGWVVAKYIFRVVTEPPPGGGAAEREAEIWESPESCATALQAGARMQRELQNPLVVGSWNVRFFPRGCPAEESCPESATDLDWLACSIVWMGVDVLAFQEILDTAAARTALAEVVEKLDTLTGGSWQSDLHECGAPGSQHVGFLWNGARAALANRRDEEQLNGAFDGSDPCAGNLRPGRYARVRSVKPAGVDLHLLSVHLDSGRRENDFNHRRAAIAELPNLEIDGRLLTEIGDGQGAAGDNDILVVGDWNTMGQGPPLEVTAEQEIALFDEELEPGFRRLPVTHGCSEYFQPQGEAELHGGLLDHLVPTLGMEEAASGGRVTGYCAVQACQPFTDTPSAFETLSDHCPLVVEIRDEDLDG
jgi:endonuclease/exonuclease/phosphatase family metal-dependent hydrolase